MRQQCARLHNTKGYFGNHLDLAVSRPHRIAVTNNGLKYDWSVGTGGHLLSQSTWLALHRADIPPYGILDGGK